MVSSGDTNPRHQHIAVRDDVIDARRRSAVCPEQSSLESATIRSMRLPSKYARFFSLVNVQSMESRTKLFLPKGLGVQLRFQQALRQARLFVRTVTQGLWVVMLARVMGPDFQTVDGKLRDDIMEASVICASKLIVRRAYCSDNCDPAVLGAHVRYEIARESYTVGYMSGCCPSCVCGILGNTNFGRFNTG